MWAIRCKISNDSTTIVKDAKHLLNSKKKDRQITFADLYVYRFKNNMEILKNSLKHKYKTFGI